MLTAPMVDKTGRSVKKKANKFKGVDANRTMDDTGRLVHMKLRVGIRRKMQNRSVTTHISKKAGLTAGATHDLGARAVAPTRSLSIQTFRH